MTKAKARKQQARKIRITHHKRQSSGAGAVAREDKVVALAQGKVGRDPQDAVALALQDVRGKSNRQNIGAWARLGAAHTAAGASEKAIAAFEHALQITPSRTQRGYLHNLLGEACVQAGQYERGWKEIQQGWPLIDAPPSGGEARPEMLARVWDGTPCPGKPLLIWGSGGAGDRW